MAATDGIYVLTEDTYVFDGANGGRLLPGYVIGIGTI